MSLIVRREERRRPRKRYQQRWQAALGLSSNVTTANLAAFTLHCASSIVFLVFLNAMQPFVIAQLGMSQKQGSLSGTLVFFDEAVSMVLALFWGSLADTVGTRLVAVIGYCFIALALCAYTLAQRAWPDLLLTRIMFAAGGSAVTAMLTGILNSYAATSNDKPRPAAMSTDHLASESDVLLNTPHSASRQRRESKQSHGRLAALAGLATGCGALFAVFVLLRLPTWLAGPTNDNDKGDKALRRATHEAFYAVATLALIVAAMLAFGLKMDAPTAGASRTHVNPSANTANDTDETAPHAEQSTTTVREARRRRLKSRLTQRATDSRTRSAKQVLQGTLSGFTLIKKDSSLLLAYVGSALARASTIATTVFIPLLVTHFFYASGECRDIDDTIPSDELKRRCRQAFTVASILSGSIQLTALLLAPLIGYLCDTFSPQRTLFFISLIATVSYATLGLGLPHNGDPRTPIAFVAAIGMGVGQIGAIVASLALCAKAKAQLTSSPSSSGINEDAQHHQDDADEEHEEEDDAHNQPHRSTVPSLRNVGGHKAVMHTSGAIAGAYSATGGFSILLISTLGGALSDRYAPAAFLLMAGLAVLTSIVTGTVLYTHSNRL